LIRASELAQLRIFSSVLSWLPSSIKIISNSILFSSRIFFVMCTNFSIDVSSLRHGQIRLIIGGGSRIRNGDNVLIGVVGGEDFNKRIIVGIYLGELLQVLIFCNYQ